MIDTTTMEFSTNILDLELKKTLHHNVGFYSEKLNTSTILPQVVSVQGVEYSVDQKRYVNIAYDGETLTCQEQPTVLIVDSLEPGVLTSFNSKPFGVITNAYNNYYCIHPGFTAPFYRFSNLKSVTVRPKSYPMAYADKFFSNKADLVAYLEAPAEASPRAATINTTCDSTQLIVHENGREIVNIIFRRPLVNRYMLDRPSTLSFRA